MQARYQDPLIGRFLSIDPVTMMDTGVTAQFNRYSYTANDPINWIDPNGECPWCIGVIIGAAIETGSQLVANGGDFSSLDYGAIGKSAVVGGLTGGLGGALAKQGARKTIGGLSNKGKGDLGEAINRGKLALKGQRLAAKPQTKVSDIPGLENVTGRGANSVADFAVKGKNGVTKVIDSKFTTTGKVSNTPAQRHLKSQIGDNFSNAVVHADDVVKAAGSAGGAVGGAIGGGASAAHNRCQDNGNC